MTSVGKAGLIVCAHAAAFTLCAVVCFLPPFTWNNLATAFFAGTQLIEMREAIPKLREAILDDVR